MRMWIWLTLASLVASGCGLEEQVGSELQCGPGTHEQRGVCVVDPSYTPTAKQPEDEKSGAPTGTSQDDDSYGSEFGTFAAFSVDTVALGQGTLSFTDASGVLACSLAEEYSATLGIPGAQVFAYPGGWAGTEPCEDRTQALSGSGCHFLSSTDSLYVGCAAYRHWDSNGEIDAFLVATGGGIKLTNLGTDCKIEVDLVFPGPHSFQYEVTVPLDDSNACIEP